MKMYSEIFRPIGGYEGLYEISNYGNVKSLNRNIIRKLSYIKGGYLHVALCKNGIFKNFLVHRLVAIAFIPKTPEDIHLGRNRVNHKAKKSSDYNYVHNLEWCTDQENVDYKEVTGTKQYGEDCSGSKLSNIQMNDIIIKTQKGWTTKALSIFFNVSASHIYKIQVGEVCNTITNIKPLNTDKIYKGISNGKNHYMSTLSDDMVRDIFLKVFKKEKTHKEIAKDYNIARTTVSMIGRRKNRKDDTNCIITNGNKICPIYFIPHKNKINPVVFL